MKKKIMKKDTIENLTLTRKDFSDTLVKFDIEKYEEFMNFIKKGLNKKYITSKYNQNWNSKRRRRLIRSLKFNCEF